MYRLYYYPGNANLAPHIALEEIGAPYELVLVDRAKRAHKAPDYLRLNPNGRIPTLVDGALVLFEAAAICLHLADRHPDAGLAPPAGTAERARFYQWLVYLTNTVQPDFLAYYYPERFTTESGGAAAAKRAAERRLDGWFDILDAAVGDGPWLLGDRFSACDPYLLMLARWGRGMARPPRALPHLGRHLERVAARPATGRALAAEGIPAPFF